MTDHHDTFDDLASAYLDGELSVEERARHAVDETVLERVEHLATARDALKATAAVVDPGKRDQAVGAALAAFESDAEASGAATGHGAVVTTAAEVATRRRAKSAARLTAIAAAVALLALLVPFLGDLDSGSDDAVVAGPTESADQILRADAPTGQAAPESMAIAGSTAMEDLGSFGEVADLASAVRTRLDPSAADESTPPGTPPAAGGGTTASEPCAAQRADLAPVVFAAMAELDGRPVLVLVRDDDESGRTLLALDVGSCAVVATQEL